MVVVDWFTKAVPTLSLLVVPEFLVRVNSKAFSTCHQVPYSGNLIETESFANQTILLSACNLGYYVDDKIHRRYMDPKIVC